MRWRGRKRFVAAVLVLGLLAAGTLLGTGGLGCLKPGGDSQPKTHVVLCQTGNAITEVGVWAAMEKGFFAKHGIEAELFLTDGDTQGLQALLSGNADFLLGGPVAGIPALASGEKVLYVASLGAAMPYLFVTRGDITDSSGLKGTRIGVSGTGICQSRVAVLVALQGFGLDPKRDNISLVPAGTASERLAALAAGGIDATVVYDYSLPKVQALEAEGKVRILADLTTMNLPWDNDSVLVLDSYAKAHPDTVDALLRALIQANAWVLNPLNKQAVLELVAAHLQYSTTAEAEPAYAVIPKNVSVRPYPNLKAVEAMLGVLVSDFPELAGVRPSDFVDTSWIERLDREGFIDAVTGGR